MGLVQNGQRHRYGDLFSLKSDRSSLRGDALSAKSHDLQKVAADEFRPNNWIKLMEYQELNHLASGTTLHGRS